MERRGALRACGERRTLLLEGSGRGPDLIAMSGLVFHASERVANGQPAFSFDSGPLL